MLDELQVFYQSVVGENYVINDKISIHHATLNEIREFGEQKYYGTVFSLCCNPSSNKVALWDRGTDWSLLTDWDLFLSLIYKGLSQEQTSILLGDLDLSTLEVAYNSQTDEKVLAEEKNGLLELVIDKAIYTEMTSYIKKIHGLEFKIDKPADEHTKKYMVEKERKKMQRHKQDKQESILKPLIGSMVNQPGFDYNYSTVWDMTISAFNESVSKTNKYIDYIQTVQAAYAGADMKNVNWEEIHWLK